MKVRSLSQWKLFFISTAISIFFLFFLILIIPDFYRDRSVDGVVSFSKNIHGPATQFDPELGWSMQLNFRGTGYYKNKISTNSLGLRGVQEIDFKKQRVLILGDSVAWGLGVNDDQTIGSFLEKRLSGFQVVNAAVSGFGIDQYDLMLRKLINYVKPSLVVTVIFSGNDIENSISNVAFYKNKPFFTFENNQLIKQGVPISKYSCHNVSSLSWIVRQVPLLNRLIRRLCKTVTVPQSIILHLLNDINQITKANAANHLFVLSGWESDFIKPDQDYLFFRNLFLEAHLPYIDVVQEPLLKNESPQELIFDEAHLSVKGNELYSKVICKRLVSLKWVSSRSCDY